MLCLVRSDLEFDLLSYHLAGAIKKGDDTSLSDLAAIECELCCLGRLGSILRILSVRKVFGGFAIFVKVMGKRDAKDAQALADGRVHLKLGRQDTAEGADVWQQMAGVRKRRETGDDEVAWRREGLGADRVGVPNEARWMERLAGGVELFASLARVDDFGIEQLLVCC